MQVGQVREGEHVGSAARDPRNRRGAGTLLRGVGLALALGFLLPCPALAGPPGEGERPNPAARLPEGEGASEHWDLTVRLDSGHLLFARFLITNLGPGERNGVAVGQVVRPDGSVKKFRNGRSRERWSLSPDRKRLDVLSSHLDLREPTYRLEIDKDSLRVDLRFPPRGGRSPPGEALPDAYGFDLLAAGSPVTGTLWVKPMDDAISVRGSATLTHAWSARSEEELFHRQVELFAETPAGALYLTEFRMPDRSSRRWYAADLAGGSVAEAGFPADFGEPRPGTTPVEAGYVPAVLEARSAGLSGRLAVGEAILEYDPLEELPQPWRLFASVRLQPRRLWFRAAGDLAVADGAGGAPPGRADNSLLAVTFPNLLKLP
jgi:hypothetical protein